ncbi:hypothetical protein MASR2M117_10300 [Paludibacter sp.]
MKIIMKHFNCQLILVLLVTTIFFSSCQKETIVTESKIPEEITTYVSTHFQSSNILQVIKEFDNLIITIM